MWTLAIAPHVSSADQEAGGPTAGDRLKEIERALGEEQQTSDQAKTRAAELEAELAQLRRELVQSGKRAHRHENELAQIESRLNELSSQESASRESLRKRRDQFADVLSALQRIARHPPEAVIAQPRDANDLVRSAILLRSAVPEIQRLSDELRLELETLADTRRQIAARRNDLAASSTELKEERARLDSLLRQKAPLLDQALAQRKAAQRRMEELAREAKDLRDLLARLERERREREERERLAREKAERERLAREKAERERLAREAAERERLAREAKERERLAREAAERERLAQEAAERERQAREARERERVARETAEKERQAREEAERRRQARQQDSGEPFSQAKGRLPLPVVGQIVELYGEHTSAGMTRKGIVIETRPEAQVLAPYKGRVVFAGPFRGYGQLLILEHSEGYHTLLAGLSRIDGVVGQEIWAGEPVGRMDQLDDPRPSLYFELRRNGRPINPLPWLASRETKVSG